MPYFTRKRYAETVGATVDAVPSSSLTGAAARVLAEDRAGEFLYGPYRFAAATAPGGTARMTLDLEGESDPLALRLRPGPLRCEESEIGRARISVSPETVRLAPGGAVAIEITVHPSENTAPGCYSGRVAVGGDASFAIALELEVEG